MKNNYSEYLKFIDEATEIVKTVPRYFSRFSNKIFCNHQKIILLVLKQKLRTTFRGLIEILKISHIPLLIGLKRIPHHTTLVKFAKKIKPSLLNLLLPFRKAKTVAVDSTGFELESKSFYYRNIDKSLFGNFKKKTKRFMKLSLSADVDKQLILFHKIRRGPRNDNIDFKSILRDIDTNFVLADKGYSSKNNRNFVFYDLDAKPIIPRKKNEGEYKFRGRNSKLVFDEKRYHQRSKVETIFSVIKKKYGSCLKARTFDSQKKEIICKLVAYNLDRIIKFYLVFLRVSAEPE